ncbi:uncharacterized protein UV8b_05474 [Ustilaginoidea virens]|uniref:Uncharacterized protein n=1 Tax=Ustilaginoidea virens TaxID=1159556 RepID=A0A8E5MIY2_USTVR|nr:uncharacterized protein UV8b_05474 [Ustilaginoidea virens]QUC21231.1 hypothetical protein UV8b_05474 [Ustilaginoidea virens]
MRAMHASSRLHGTCSFPFLPGLRRLGPVQPCANSPWPVREPRRAWASGLKRWPRLRGCVTPDKAPTTATINNCNNCNNCNSKNNNNNNSNSNEVETATLQLATRQPPASRTTNPPNPDVAEDALPRAGRFDTKGPWQTPPLGQMDLCDGVLRASKGMMRPTHAPQDIQRDAARQNSIITRETSGEVLLILTGHTG